MGVPNRYLTSSIMAQQTEAQFRQDELNNGQDGLKIYLVKAIHGVIIS